MIISLCIVAYNEERSLEKLFKDILNQDYPKEKTEVILINNGSNDNTLTQMKSFKSRNLNMNISVITIPRSNLATACNVALESFKGDIYVRVDAHAGIDKSFLSSIVKCIKSGENVCGGYRPCIVQENSPMQKTLLVAEESMFGSSIADYRRKHDKKCYLNSLFHIAVKRDVLKKIGGYNEILGRTEDNEFNYRLRQNGYKLCYSPEIKSYQYIRSSFSKMVKQKYSNGYWIGLTLGISPKCLSVFHFAPFCMLLAFVISFIFSFLGFTLFLYLLSLVYLLFDIIITISALITSKRIYPQFALLPLIFPALHFSYGIGTLIGIIKLPFWKSNIEKKYEQRINDIKKIP